ncbi:citrate synthase I [Chryseobacterium sp. StRB126]|uniref:hypothetical protein n=1 Tax=Chryseobacterium sp. StRB126 TaxID=878220 RepID=UPI0004E99340|nr:hypothetical protein [Chryseobacterium sp. StRB126]BAP32518.1 citrate synthase I [Chryseobacterium sp. StRB126]
MNKLKKRLHYYIFKRQSKWNYLLLVLILSPLFFYIYYKQSPVDKGNYTIGQVYKIYWPVISNKTIMFSYTINNKEYTSTDIFDSRYKPEVGKFYLVQVSLEDNSFSTIFQNISVPDSIKKAPAHGWKELPKWAKEK